VLLTVTHISATKESFCDKREVGGKGRGETTLIIALPRSTGEDMAHYSEGGLGGRGSLMLFGGLGGIEWTPLLTICCIGYRN
jgi:hypothetical protein